MLTATQCRNAKPKDRPYKSAVDRLKAFIAGRRSSKEPCGDMECFERELHEYVVAVEREVAEELARLDVDLPTVTLLSAARPHQAAR